MNTQKDPATSQTDGRNTTQWNQSGGPDTKPAGDDTKKTPTDPQPKQNGVDPKKV
jgi:hypothetical protein